MNADDYKKQGTKIIDLPSGIKARVRQVKVMPYLISGQLPNVFALDTGEIKNPELESVSLLLTNILCESVHSLIFEDSELKLVNKPMHECSKNELSYIDTLTNEDATALFQNAFTDLAPADGGAGHLKTFRASSGE
tara:strand:+ start:964 stop:1371 length:408 start_codon:yes stop_codon:yes gene_type:complete